MKINNICRSRGDSRIALTTLTALTTLIAPVTMYASIVICLSYSSVCLADAKEEAKEKFMEGVRNFSDENYPDALAAFEESYRLRPKASVLFNIGMCQKAMFRYIEAIDTFNKFLSESGEKTRKAMINEARAALKELEQLVGSLRLTNAPDGARVFVEGREIGRTPLSGPVMLNPGSHVLEVKKDGFEPLKTGVTIPSGAEIAVSAALSPLKAVIKVQCREKAAVVRIDGKVVGSCPFMGEAAPGIRKVVITAQEKEDFAGEVRAVPGRTSVLNAVLKRKALPEEPEPEPVPEPEKPEDDEEAPSALFISGLVSIGVGAAGMGVGGYFTYVAYEDFDKGEKAADAGDTETYNDVRDNRLPDDEAGMIAGFVAGGALIVAGVVMLIIDNEGEAESDSAASVSSTGNGILLRF